MDYDNEWQCRSNLLYDVNGNGKYGGPATYARLDVVATRPSGSGGDGTLGEPILRLHQRPRADRCISESTALGRDDRGRYSAISDYQGGSCTPGICTA